MTAGSVVEVPWPSSEAGDTMVMVPSGEIVSQTFGANGASASASPVRASGSVASVNASVRPAAAVPRKLRRFRCVFMVSPPAPHAGSR